MKTVYACTHVSKDVAVDDYGDGCTEERTTTMDERCNIVAPTLPELIKKLGETYGLRMDDLFLPCDGDDRNVPWFGFNRTENEDGNEPTKAELAKWKRGKATLYLADYSFSVERRTVETLTAADFNGIATH